MINIIAAVSENGIIGNDNKLLWKLSSDLKRFKELTTGCDVIMGRKTYDSIGRPLPNRRNIVITRQKDLTIEGCEIVNSLEEALSLASDDCFIIGGGEIYKQSMDIAGRIYLTVVNCVVEGDTSFPEIEDDWMLVNLESFDKNEKNEYDYSFLEYMKFDF